MLVMVNFHQILEYLSGSVQICTDSQGVLNMGCSLTELIAQTTIYDFLGLRVFYGHPPW